MSSGDGSTEIIGQLGRIIQGLQSNIPQEAGQQWIEQDAKPEAQRLVPVATGATRDSIDGNAGPGGVTMFASTPYAPDIEFGTSKMAARPFLKPAITSKLSALGGHFQDAINRRK